MPHDDDKPVFNEESTQEGETDEASAGADSSRPSTVIADTFHEVRLETLKAEAERLCDGISREHDKSGRLYFGEWNIDHVAGGNIVLFEELLSYLRRWEVLSEQEAVAFSIVVEHATYIHGSLDAFRQLYDYFVRPKSERESMIAEHLISGDWRTMGEIYKYDLASFFELKDMYMALEVEPDDLFFLERNVVKLPVHGNRMDFFKECLGTFVEIAKSHRGETTIHTLLHTKKLYGTDMQKFREYARYAKEGMPKDFRSDILTPDDVVLFDEFADGCNAHPFVGEGMDNLYELTRGELTQLRRLKAILISAGEFEGGEAKNEDAIKTVECINSRISESCTGSWEERDTRANTLRTVLQEGGLDLLAHVTDAVRINGGDMIVPLLDGKRIAADDEVMFQTFLRFTKRSPARENPDPRISPEQDRKEAKRNNVCRLTALLSAAPFYGKDTELFRIAADHYSESRDMNSDGGKMLADLFEGCDRDAAFFKEVLKTDSGYITTRVSLTLKQLHQNNIERYKKALAIINRFMRTDFMGDYETKHLGARDFLVAQKDIIGDSFERLQAVCDVYAAEFATSNRLRRDVYIPYYALKGASEAFVGGRNIILAAPHLALACSKIAILYGAQGIDAIRRVYEREPHISPYELFMGVISSEINEPIKRLAVEFEDKNSKECLETLAMAVSIYQNVELEREKRISVDFSDRLTGKGHRRFVEDTHTAIARICDEAHGDRALVMGCIEILQQFGPGGLDKYLELFTKLHSQEQKKLVIDTVRSLLWRWDAIGWDDFSKYLKSVADAGGVFKADIEKFRMYTEVIKTKRRFGGGILAAKDIYGDDMQKFRVFVDATQDGDDLFCMVLVACRELYKDNYDRLCGVRDMLYGSLEPYGNFQKRRKREDDGWWERPAQSYYYVCHLLAATKGIYRDNEVLFHQVEDLVFGLAQREWNSEQEELMRWFIEKADIFGGSIDIFKEYIEMSKMKSGVALCHRLAESKKAYGGNPEILREFRKTLEEHGEVVAYCLQASHPVYQQDFACFLEVRKEIMEVQKEAGDEACKTLGETMGYYTKPTLPLIKFFANILKEDGVAMCANLRNTRQECGTDIEELQIARRFFEADFDYHPVVLRKYIEKFQTEGERSAGEYLADLREKIKQVIGPGVPDSIRNMPEYPFLVAQVFPKGNYSDYEKNARCGDRLKHVQKYRFPRDGYPGKLSGLMGYKLKDGQTEDREVLEAYSGRLAQMREFVASRGPNNQELQKVFDEKVDSLYKTHCHATFTQIKDLTTKEKMILLFLSEVMRKTSDPKHFQPNPEVLDLVVEYKYAYEENLEAYIQHSADAVRTQRDEVSQHYMLFNELSTIYGENLKHVLQHNIFGELEASERWPQIQTAYASLFHIETEPRDLTEKQWGRIRNTFENPYIPAETRFSVLQKQLQSLFGNNIEFGRDEVKAEFYERLAKLLAPLQEDFSVEKFRGLLPSLFALREEYRFRINAKLEELFSYDINAISREVSKYEPVVEVEEKERRMGGPKEKLSKKVLKGRNIRGYITKTKETANARMGAYLCIAGDEWMWRNENYFELVLKDEDTGKCVGVVMLLNIETEDGRKYLWFGPNPFESFLDQVSSEQCYNYLYQTVAQFAGENNFDGIIIPKEEGRILGECTNRGGNFPDLIKQSRLRDAKGRIRIVDFDGHHELGHYGSHSYSYSSGALIWEKKAA